MKKFLSILLALVLTAGMGFSFLAYAVESPTTVTVENDGKDSAVLPVSGEYASVNITPIYCVTVETESLDFEYNIVGGLVWNPQSLKYENKAIYEWVDDAKTVKVTNKSNVPVHVAVEVSFEQVMEGSTVDVTIANDGEIDLKAAQVGDNVRSAPHYSFMVQVGQKGRPNLDWKSGEPHKIATLEITLAAVSENQ